MSFPSSYCLPCVMELAVLQASTSRICIVLTWGPLSASVFHADASNVPINNFEVLSLHLEPDR